MRVRIKWGDSRRAASEAKSALLDALVTGLSTSFVPLYAPPRPYIIPVRRSLPRRSRPRPRRDYATPTAGARVPRAAPATALDAVHVLGARRGTSIVVPRSYPPVAVRYFHPITLAVLQAKVVRSKLRFHNFDCEQRPIANNRGGGVTPRVHSQLTYPGTRARDLLSGRVVP